jgi:predicted DNA-binding transcriptional regulator AlpA
MTHDATVDRRIGIGEVERITGRHRTTVWRWMRAGTFPAAAYIAGRRAWWLSAVREWETGQLARPPPGMPPHLAAHAAAVRR